MLGWPGGGVTPSEHPLLARAGLTFGLSDLRGHFQPEGFCDSDSLLQNWACPSLGMTHGWVGGHVQAPCSSLQGVQEHSSAPWRGQLELISHQVQLHVGAQSWRCVVGRQLDQGSSEAGAAREAPWASCRTPPTLA